VGARHVRGPDGSIEVLVFPDTYAALPRPLEAGEVVVISGSLDRRDDQPKLRAVQVLWLPEAHEQLLRETGAPIAARGLA